MKEPTDKALWAMEGTSQVAFESILRDFFTPTVNTPKRYLNSRGFKLKYGAARSYAEGPCLECGYTYKSEQLNAKRICSKCEAGLKVLNPQLERERKASKRRLQKRLDGKLPPLGQPRSPIVRTGHYTQVK